MIDTNPLQERIARALYENAEYYGPEDAQPPWDSRDDEERGEWMEIAAAVLPIVAAEVQAAKATALRGAAEDLFYDGDQDVPIEGNALLHSRADEYETGGSDDRR